MTQPDTVLAYAAGILDGEGCIHINRTYPAGNSTTYTLKVSVGNTDRSLVEQLVAWFGGAIYTTAGTNKPYHTWSLTGKRAATFLQTVKAFVRVKRKQLDTALIFASTSATRLPGKPYSPAISAERRYLYVTLQQQK